MRSDFLKFPKNVYLLSISQIIGMSATTLVFLLGGLIGAEIAPSPTLATLPLTLMIVGLAAATIPATLLMKKIGRKKGFLFSAIFSACIAVLAAYAISQDNFILFCFTTLLLGTHGAFVQQYRFAALESVPKHLESKAVGLVLMAGIFAGFFGPEIAKRTKDIYFLPEYTGSFISLAVLFGIAAVLLSFIKESKIADQKVRGEERPLRLIAMQPVFRLAVLAAVTGYGVMVFIMSATPLQLHKISHFSLDHTAFIIQSHIIAMFLPSLFTGVLIARFGIFRILLTGIVGFFASIFIAINANSISAYWIALVLLGTSWNFLFISSTVLLPKTYNQTERFKTQGLNDFIVVLSQMLASFFAGSLLFRSGWVSLNLIALPIILGAMIIFLLQQKTLSFTKSSETQP